MLLNHALWGPVRLYGCLRVRNVWRIRADRSRFYVYAPCTAIAYRKQPKWEITKISFHIRNVAIVVGGKVPQILGFFPQRKQRVRTEGKNEGTEC